jgi:plastocyanin
MRRSLPLLALVTVAALAAACTSSNAPGWTYAAPTSPPPSQPAASGAPSSAAPSSGAAPSGSAAAPSTPPASGSTGAGAVQMSALNVQFEQQQVSAPAGTPFTIHFDNKDAGQPHNIDIKDARGASVFKGAIVTGPTTTDYSVPALTAGTYTFVCDVHANMTGTLTAG